MYLINADIKKTAELNLNVYRVLLIIINCEKIVKSESYKEVTQNMVHRSY